MVVDKLVDILVDNLVDIQYTVMVEHMDCDDNEDYMVHYMMDSVINKHLRVFR